MTSDSPLMRLLLKYSRFMGGIDASRALRDNEEARVRWLRQYLGIDVEPSSYDVSGEVRRIRAMHEWLMIEEANMQRAIVDAKSMGLAQGSVSNKLRQIRSKRRLLAKILKEAGLK